MKEVCRLECARILRNSEISIGKDGLLDKHLQEKFYDIYPRAKISYIEKWIKKTEKELIELKKRLITKIEKKDKDNKFFVMKKNKLIREIKCAKKYIEAVQSFELGTHEKIRIIRTCKKSPTNIYHIKICVRAAVYNTLTDEKISKKFIMMKSSTIIDSSFLLKSIYQHYEDRWGLPPSTDLMEVGNLFNKKHLNYDRKR